MIKTILWDVDGTLVSFTKSEEAALKQLFHDYHIPFSKENLDLYKLINRQCWVDIEQNKKNRQDALTDRFSDFFKALNLPQTDFAKVNQVYQELLGEYCFPIDDAKDVLESLTSYKQYVVSNGSKIAQERKLHKTKFETYFEDIFISEVVGYEKPHENFFDYVQKKTQYDNHHTVIIGDTLSSDILGGINAKIHTIWFNPQHIKNETTIIPEYTISNLKEIKDILIQL